MDRWVERWLVRSNSNRRGAHTVAKDKDGNYGCTCPSWKFHRRECSHVQMVKAGLDKSAEVVMDLIAGEVVKLK